MSRTISELTPGTKVYYDVTRDGETKPWEFIVLGASEQGNSVLIMSALCFMAKRMNATEVAEYNGCEADAFLDGDFLTTYFDEKFIAALTPTQIKCYSIAAAATQTFARKCFLPSYTELGWTSANDEGASYLPALKTWSNNTNDNAARVAYNTAGAARWWWVRSACSDSQFWYVHNTGVTFGYVATTPNIWLRPVLSVANATIVSDQGEETIYILPDPNKLYREAEATLYLGSSVKRPKKVRLLTDVENATEQVWKVSNNAKDTSPVWVTTAADGTATLENTTKTTDNWELGVHVYVKSGGKAIVQEPILLVETEEAT